MKGIIYKGSRLFWRLLLLAIVVSFLFAYIYNTGYFYALRIPSNFALTASDLFFAAFLCFIPICLVLVVIVWLWEYKTIKRLVWFLPILLIIAFFVGYHGARNDIAIQPKSIIHFMDGTQTQPVVILRSLKRGVLVVSGGRFLFYGWPKIADMQF